MSIKTTLTPSIYNFYRKKIPSPLAARYANLNDDQLVAIFAYTTNATYNSYKDINYQLRSQNISPEHFEFVQAINSAIGSIKKDRSAGIYYRYTTLSRAQVKSIYTKGRITSHTFFTSVSEKNANFIDPKCNVLLRITPDPTIVPAYIAEISRFPDEKEYLFPPNTFFEVLQVTDLGSDTFEVVLLERPL